MDFFTKRTGYTGKKSHLLVRKVSQKKRESCGDNPIGCWKRGSGGLVRIPRGHILAFLFVYGSCINLNRLYIR